MDNKPPKFVTAQNLIDALRSAEPKTRQDALDAVFPDCSVLLVAATPQITQCSTTTKVDPPSLFSGVLFAQQQIGKMLGLDLKWVRDEAAESKKLLVAPPGSFR